MVRRGREGRPKRQKTNGDDGNDLAAAGNDRGSRPNLESAGGRLRSGLQTTENANGKGGGGAGEADFGDLGILFTAGLSVPLVVGLEAELENSESRGVVGATMDLEKAVTSKRLTKTVCAKVLNSYQSQCVIYAGMMLAPAMV